MRNIIYEFAVSNNIKHKFNSETKMCGKSRNLRRPEATSSNRVFPFKRTDVNLFYDNLEQVMKKYNFTGFLTWMKLTLVVFTNRLAFLLRRIENNPIVCRVSVSGQ